MLVMVVLIYFRVYFNEWEKCLDVFFFYYNMGLWNKDLVLWSFVLVNLLLVLGIGYMCNYCIFWEFLIDFWCFSDDIIYIYVCGKVKLKWFLEKKDYVEL